jgi:hypothetical protein
VRPVEVVTPLILIGFDGLAPVKRAIDASETSAPPHVNV